MHNILVLNLGGTSSKLAVYRDRELVIEQTFRHSVEEMKKVPTSREQLIFRKKLILDWLGEHNLKMGDFGAVAARGATLKIAGRSGTYLVTGTYQKELMELYFPDKPLVHGIRMLAPLTLSLVEGLDIPIYITDPPSVDEMTPKARITGLKGYLRRSRFHALNQRMAARKYAEKHGRDLHDCRLVVAHLGAGISIGAHEYGRIVDASDAGEGSGPFTPERAGTVTTEVMLDICYQRKLKQEEFFSMVRGKGGLMAHLGTADLREVEAMIDEGNDEAALVHEAMVYQIAKEIGSYATVLKFYVDAIILTGGLSYSERLVASLKDYVGKLAPVEVYAGEFENEALAAGALRVLRGEEEPIIL